MGTLFCHFWQKKFHLLSVRSRKSAIGAPWFIYGPKLTKIPQRRSKISTRPSWPRGTCPDFETKNRKLCTSSFILRQEPVETKANQCADPIRKISTNEKKRLKRKIDKWCDHHKISNKNITKGEIPMALKILKEMAP